jgi:hypothetical protein
MLLSLLTVCLTTHMPFHTLRMRRLHTDLIRDSIRAERATSDITLSASPDYITVDRAKVTVSWAGVAAPSDNDWIGIYSPVPDKLLFNVTTPVKLQMANSVPSHRSQGKGNLTFGLLNLRGNYIFAFFRSGAKEAENPHSLGPYQTAVAVSNVVTLAAELQDSPSAVHLSLTGTEGEMTVMWTTKTIGAPAVQWGLTALPGQDHGINS